MGKIHKKKRLKRRSMPKRRAATTVVTSSPSVETEVKPAQTTTAAEEVAVDHQSDRERRRQMSVNDAFEALRSKIPCHPANKKMSKHEILRGAIRYLTILEYLTEADSDKPPAHELALYTAFPD